MGASSEAVSNEALLRHQVSTESAAKEPPFGADSSSFLLTLTCIKVNALTSVALTGVPVRFEPC